MFLTQSWIADLLIVALLMVIGAHAGSLVLRKKWMLLDPLNFFWGGMVVVYVLQPIQHSALLLQWREPGILEKTLLWTIFAVVCVIIGYESRIGPAFANLFKRLPPRLLPGRLTTAAIVLGALGVLGYLYLFQTSGGMTVWLSVGRGGTNWAQASHYLASLANFLPAGVAVFFLQVNIHHGSFTRKTIAWVLMVMVWLWFFYLGSRSRTIQVLLWILMAYFVPRRKNPPVLLLVMGFAAMLVVTQFQAYYRGYFTGLSLNLDQIDISEVRQRILPSLLGGTSDEEGVEVSHGLEMNCSMAAVELVPDKVPFNRGSCLLEFFTRVIPRQFWPEKRYPHYEAFTPIYEQGDLSANWVITGSNPILAGPSFGFVGHYYAIWGALGLIVGGVLSGALYRTIRLSVDRQPLPEGAMVLYPFLATVGFFDAAGTPFFWVFTVPFILLPLWFMVMVCRDRSRVIAPFPG